MTTQEEQMLQDLTDRITHTLSEKDPQADSSFSRRSAETPTPSTSSPRLYWFRSTHSIRLRSSSADARAQLDQLRQQQQQPEARHQLPRQPSRPQRRALGSCATAAPIRPTATTPVPAHPAPTPAFGAPQYGAPQSGGFLRLSMQTATGVAAGALAFEGIESLMHGFGHSTGYGSGIGGFGETNRPEEVINNYYGDASPHEHEHQSSDFDDRHDDSRLSDATFRDDQGDSSLTSDDLANDSADFDDSSDFDSGSNDDNSF